MAYYREEPTAGRGLEANEMRSEMKFAREFQIEDEARTREAALASGYCGWCIMNADATWKVFWCTDPTPASNPQSS